MLLSCQTIFGEQKLRKTPAKIVLFDKSQNELGKESVNEQTQAPARFEGKGRRLVGRC